MQISILSAQATTQNNSKGKPMQVLEVAYKNLTFQGKVESKKLFDFGVQKDAFKTLATAQIGQVYEVNVVKNEAGYNDWVKVEKSNSTDGATTVTSPSPRSSSTVSGSVQPATKGTWETPVERAQKQLYIIRQSNLSTAVATLTVGRKTEIKPEEVFALAKQYEDYVMNKDTEEAISQDINKVPGFEDFQDDQIPF